MAFPNAIAISNKNLYSRKDQCLIYTTDLIILSLLSTLDTEINSFITVKSRNTYFTLNTFHIIEHTEEPDFPFPQLHNSWDICLLQVSLGVYLKESGDLEVPLAKLVLLVLWETWVKPKDLLTKNPDNCAIEKYFINWKICSNITFFL